MEKNKQPVRVSTVLIYVFFSFMMVLYLAPLGWIILTSLKTKTEIYRTPFGWPKEFQWGNYVYAWKGNGGSGNQNSAWPGVKMTKTGTKVGGYDLYSYTSSNFLGTWTNVIFTNNSGSQTKDITISTNCYNAAGTASTYTPTTTTNTNNTVNNNVIYFINTKKWSTVYCYAWKGNGGSGNQLSSWPGVKMTKTSKKVNGYYVWKLESTNILTNWEKVIFTNGSAQTKDITITTNCYNAAGTASTYNG